MADRKCVNCGSIAPGRRGKFKLGTGWVCGWGCFLCLLATARILENLGAPAVGRVV